ncbi:MAG: glycerol-3-phosphate 1-O-acyltransferase PlsY [Planctomycetaceae bacterium]|nr:glycerol-3-phosphate 1-O-acyltransferase PlsY [Planctomycetaceae bacterium]
MMTAFAVIATAGFLIGGIPFGYLAGWVSLREDIRQHGSGNIGATNVWRVLGARWGVVVLLLDALKGMGPTLLARWWFQSADLVSWNQTAMVTGGIAAVMGHMYPVYLRLRGGKGVATGLGVVAVVGPLPTLAALLIFLLLATTTRIIALASMGAAVTYGVAQLVQLGGEAMEPHQIALTAFAISVPLLIIWKHRSNISRILSGTESRFSFRRRRTLAEQPVSADKNAI